MHALSLATGSCYIPICSHLWTAQCYEHSYKLELLGTCRHKEQGDLAVELRKVIEALQGSVTLTPPVTESVLRGQLRPVPSSASTKWLESYWRAALACCCCTSNTQPTCLPCLCCRKLCVVGCMICRRNSIVMQKQRDCIVIPEGPDVFWISIVCSWFLQCWLVQCVSCLKRCKHHHLTCRASVSSSSDLRPVLLQVPFLVRSLDTQAQ